MEKDLSVNTIIEQILSASVNNGIVAVVSSKPEDTETSECILISRETDDSSLRSHTWLKQIKSHPGRAIAIVDRTANVEEAAQSIVNASLAFRGRSPYSPHLVFVNEFVEEAFIRAATRHSQKFLNKNSYLRNDGKNAHVDRELKGGVKSKDIEVIQSGAPATILKLKSRYVVVDDVFIPVILMMN